MGGSSLLLPYLVMLTSVTQCTNKLLTVIVLECNSVSLLFFNYYRKADMYTVGVYVKFFCQQYLKIK